MSLTHVEVEGTLQPDGTLLLDEKPRLPPGRVIVTVQPVVPLPADDPFWQRMQAIWDALAASGHVPRTREQIDAELRELDDEADAEMKEIERLQQECREQVRPAPAEDSSL